MTGVDLTSTTHEAQDLRAQIRAAVEAEYLRLRSVDRPAVLQALATSPAGPSPDTAVLEDELALLDRRIGAIRSYFSAVRTPTHTDRPGVDYCVLLDLGDGPEWMLLTDLPVLDERVVVTDSALGNALLDTAVGDTFRYRTPHGDRDGTLLALEGPPRGEAAHDGDLAALAAGRRLVEIDRARAFELLRGHSPGVGRLAFNLFGIPHIEVVNFLLDEGDVIFRIDPGSKLIAVLHGAQFAFQVDDIDWASRSGWTVTVSGPAYRVTGPAAQELVARLTPWASGDRRFVIRLKPRAVFGRCLIPHGTDQVDQPAR